MDDLRHVQLLLKREDIFTDFQAHEIQDLNKSLRCECQEVLCQQKFLLFLHVTSMGSKAVQLEPAFFDSLFENREKNDTSSPHLAPNQIPIYNRVISGFVDTVTHLAAACADLAKKKPQYLDQMAFSTVPGLFGYLWSAESAQKFLGFLQELIKQAPEYASAFARVVFAVPPFRQFFDAVMGDLVNRVANVKSKEDADAFVNDFIEKWTENAPFCPNIVKETLAMAADQADLLIGAFLVPAFASPRTFGIIPLSLRIGSEPTDLILESLKGRAGEMCEVLAKVENPTTLPSSEKLSKILPDLGKNALFTADDLEVLSALVESINEVHPDFPVKAAQLDPAGAVTQKKYQAFSFTLPTVQEVHRANSGGETGSQEDELEKQLREMLTGVDVIPLAAQSSGTPDMVELLKSQVQLARPDHRLLLEMKIDDFERAREHSSVKYDFRAFLDLLKRKFEERQPQRLDKLSKISLYNTEYSQMGQLCKSLKAAIDVYRNVLKFHLVEQWLNQANPLSEISDELCQERELFRTFFCDIIKKWKEWCTAHEYKDQGCEAILHNIVMTELPQERFLKMNPTLAQKDERCYQGLVDKRDHFLKENTFDFTSTFQQNPKLLEAAQRQLQKAWDAPLPLAKLDGFCAALNTLVFVLTFEGHKEIGADQWLPMTILLLLLSQPKQLPSTMAYIDHFVKSLSDETSTNERLITEQTDYNFTMIKSALLHFGQTIPDIDIAQPQ